jgi:hypothetical protein
MRLFRKNLFILVVFIWINNLLAQGPDTLWTRTYGGSDDDYGWAVQEAEDGGYIIIGSSLIKTDANGDTLWVKSIQGFSGQQTSDGGYIVAGCTRSNSHYTLQLTKVDTNGGIVWVKKFEGVELGIGRSVDQTMDGGYIITGNTKGGICLIKTDYNGDSVWVSTYGHGKSYSACQTIDGGYIITGGTCDVHGGSRVFLIKTDNYSQTLWVKTYGLGFKSLGYSVLQTRDSGYVIVGSPQIDEDNMNDADICLIKTDSLGDTLWTKTYGGEKQDVGWSLRQTSDNGYIIAGYTQSFGSGGWDVYLIKTDTVGDTIWTKTYGEERDDLSRAIQATTDGGYIIVGKTRSFGAGDFDVYLIKTKPDVSIK